MLLHIFSIFVSFLTTMMNQDEENFEEVIMFKGKTYYEVSARVFPKNSTNSKMDSSPKNFTIEISENSFLNWSNPSYFKFFSEIKFKANTNFNLMMIGTFAFILISIISTFLREGKHFKILFFLVSLGAFLFSFFSSIIEKSSSVLISCGYFYTSMYLVHYLKELLLEQSSLNNGDESTEFNSNNINPCNIKSKMLLHFIFIVFCFWMSLHRTNELFSIPFIISFLHLISEICQFLKCSKFLLIQPVSYSINIIIGLIWICGLNFKTSIIFPLFGVLIVQYYLYYFVLCKYYNLENLYLTDYSNYEKKQKDYLENFSEPLERNDFIILLLLLFNIWIVIIGILNFSCIFLIAAQFGFQRTYEYFIAAKRKIVLQILEIIIFFIMAVNYFSYNINRELHFRLVF